MIAALSMLVKTFSFMLLWSTAVMTVRLVIDTTIATSRIMKSDCFEPFAAALSAIAFILATSSVVRRMLRDSRRCWAWAENLSGCPTAGACAVRRTSRNEPAPVGGIWTGTPCGRATGLIAGGMIHPSILGSAMSELRAGLAAADAAVPIERIAEVGSCSGVAVGVDQQLPVRVGERELRACR